MGSQLGVGPKAGEREAERRRNGPPLQDISLSSVYLDQLSVQWIKMCCNVLPGAGERGSVDQSCPG